MAKRNMVNIADKQKINDNYDMTVEELNTLINYMERNNYDMNALYRVIIVAFKFGYAMGERATKKEFIKE